MTPASVVSKKTVSSYSPKHPFILCGLYRMPHPEIELINASTHSAVSPPPTTNTLTELFHMVFPWGLGGSIQPIWRGTVIGIETDKG